MKNPITYLKKQKKFVITFFILTIIIILNVISRNSLSFSTWYSENIYPFFVNTLGRFFSIFPFSVFEFLIYIFILSFATGVFVNTFYFIKKRINPFKSHYFKKFLLDLFIFTVCIFSIFTLTAGINYHREPFSKYSGLTVNKYSSDDLYVLCEYLIEKTNALSEKIPTDKNGLCILPKDSEKTAVDSMKKLGDSYEVLSGYYPFPKYVLFSEFMSYQLITGIYSPFTIEANYNNHSTAAFIPATMCHELSHLKGFMKEDEAEFISYLACRISDNVVFQYSGYLNALVHSMNALYKSTDRDVYMQLRSKFSPQINAELLSDSYYWDNYSGPIAEISNKTNDTYLKANAQTDGVKSYGRMVDLLLADFIS